MLGTNTAGGVSYVSLPPATQNFLSCISSADHLFPIMLSLVCSIAPRSSRHTFSSVSNRRAQTWGNKSDKRVSSDEIIAATPANSRYTAMLYF